MQQNQGLYLYHWNSKPNQQILHYLDGKKKYVEYAIVDDQFIQYKLDYTKCILLSDLFVILDYNANLRQFYKNPTLIEVKIQLTKLYEEIKEMINFKLEQLDEHYILVVLDETNQFSFKLIFLGQSQIHFANNIMNICQSRSKQTLEINLLEFVFNRFKSIQSQNSFNFYLKDHIIGNLQLRDTYLKALDIENQIKLSEKQLKELQNYNFKNDNLETMNFIYNFSLRHVSARMKIFSNISFLIDFLELYNIKNCKFILLICSTVNFNNYRGEIEYQKVFEQLYDQMYLTCLSQLKKYSDKVAFQFLLEFVCEILVKMDISEDQYDKQFANVFKDLMKSNYQLVKECHDKLNCELQKIKQVDFNQTILEKYCRMALGSKQIRDRKYINKNIENIVERMTQWSQQKYFEFQYQFIKDYAYEDYCQQAVKTNIKFLEKDYQNQLTKLESKYKFELNQLSSLEKEFNRELLFNNEYLIQLFISTLKQRIDKDIVNNLFKDGNLLVENYDKLKQEIIQITLYNDIERANYQVQSILMEYDQEPNFQVPKFSYQFDYYRRVAHQIITINWNPNQVQLSQYDTLIRKSLEQNKEKLNQIQVQFKELFEQENIREIIVKIMITSLLINYQKENQFKQFLQKQIAVYRQFENKLNTLQPTYLFIQDLLFQQALYSPSDSYIEEQLSNQLNEFGQKLQKELLLLLELQYSVSSQITSEQQPSEQQPQIQSQIEKLFFELIDEDKLVQILTSKEKEKHYVEHIKIQILDFIRIQKEEEKQQLQKQKIEAKQRETETQQKQIEQEVTKAFKKVDQISKKQPIQIVDFQQHSQTQIQQNEEQMQLVKCLQQFSVQLDQPCEYQVQDLEKMLKNEISQFFIQLIQEFFSILVDNLNQQYGNNQTEDVQKQIKQIKLKSNSQVYQFRDNNFNQLKYKSKQDLKIYFYVELWINQVEKPMYDIYMKEHQQNLTIDPKIYFNDEQSLIVLKEQIENRNMKDDNQIQNENKIKQPTQHKLKKNSIRIKQDNDQQNTINAQISEEMLFLFVKQLPQKLCNQYDQLFIQHLVEYQKEEIDFQISKCLENLKDDFKQFYQHSEQLIKYQQDIQIKKYILDNFWCKEYESKIIDQYESYLNKYEGDYQNLEQE